METWKSIPGYEDLYEVSDKGNVRSLLKRTKSTSVKLEKPLILSPCKTKDGYLFVRLFNKDSGKNFRINRLVLFAFVGECPEGYYAVHLNGKSDDNRLENLKYATPTENQLHRFIHGTISSKFSVDVVKKIRRLSSEGSSNRELANMYDVNIETIRKIIKKERWSNCLIGI